MKDSTPQTTETDDVQLAKTKPIPRPRRQKTAPKSIIITDDGTDEDEDVEVTWCANAPPGSNEVETGVPHDTSDLATTDVDTISQSTGDGQDTGEIVGDGSDEGAQSSIDEESESHHSDAGEDEAAIDGDEAAVAELDTSVEDVGEEEVETAELDTSATDEDGAEGGINQQAPEQSPPPPRKPPARNRRPPEWLRSGDYNLSQTVQQPEWVQKAEYLKDLIHSGLCDESDMRHKATESLLSVLTK